MNWREQISELLSLIGYQQKDQRVKVAESEGLSIILV